MMIQTKAEPAKAMSKTEIASVLSEATGLAKNQVSLLFDELAKLIGKNLGAGGPGVFAIPGLLKISVVRKPATEARIGINPFTKEQMTFKAKPAKNVVKVSALKGLKEMV
jgi:nucleoid DNA-binding protein